MRWLLGLMLLAATAHAEVSPDRLHALSRGINIDYAVFEIPRSPSEWAQDFAAIQRAGLHHVRIFVFDEWLNNLAVDANWRITRLDAIVQEATRNHLAVILCLYPQKYRLDNHATAATIQHWQMAWQQLATHYRTISPEQMFFEIANEPSMDEPRWSKVQDQFRSTVRQIAPSHTLLLTPSPLAMVWSLSAMTLSSDTNVAYVFHLYQPMVFTHQSAGWSEPYYEPITGLIYPPDKANIHALMKQPKVAANAESMKVLAQYERNGSTMIRDEIAVAQRWASRYKVPVVVTEFGNYATAPPASRAAWLREAREQIEAAQFGWTVWQYEGSFEVKSNLRDCNSIKQALGLCR